MLNHADFYAGYVLGILVGLGFMWLRRRIARYNVGSVFAEARRARADNAKLAAEKERDEKVAETLKLAHHADAYLAELKALRADKKRDDEWRVAFEAAAEKDEKERDRLATALREIAKGGTRPCDDEPHSARVAADALKNISLTESK